MELEALKQFLVYAKLNSYANDSVKYNSTQLNTKQIAITNGNFLFIDEYVGENPFSGVETVFYKGKPIWQMHYYGSTIENPDKVYSFLKKALRNIDEDFPLRGKDSFNNGTFSYHIKINGSMEQFKALETIAKEGKEIYKCKIMGGIVD